MCLLIKIMILLLLLAVIILLIGVFDLEFDLIKVDSKIDKILATILYGIITIEFILTFVIIWNVL